MIFELKLRIVRKICIPTTGLMIEFVVIDIAVKIIDLEKRKRDHKTILWLIIDYSLIIRLSINCLLTNRTKLCKT
jgi:hypothetical protein